MKMSDSDWNKKLTPEQYHVLREKGTEAPFSGKYVKFSKKGKYVCAACGNELFSSDTKFDSNCGWPSFYDAKKDAVEFKKDSGHGMERIEVICKKCNGHLGHIFDDGPKPTGKRYCINSAALNFKKKNMPAPINKIINKIINPKINKKTTTEAATFGAGCFWQVEEEFRTIKGVEKTIVGYMGGTLKNPTYEQVCSDKTGYVEVCRVEYDQKTISYEKLLKIFWRIHDPTQLNRQGLDLGTQYRSAIFYHDEEQRKLALISLKKEQAKYKKNKKKIKTSIKKALKFYPAEEYHQKYLLKKGSKTC